MCLDGQSAAFHHGELGFGPGKVHVGFVMGKVSLRCLFSDYYFFAESPFYQ